MRRLTVASFCALITTIWAASVGCELVAAVDRSQISSGTGGAPTTTTTTTSTTSTSTNGGMGGGGGMPCTTPQDCPSPANECVDRTCSNGMCGTVNLAQGTVTATQKPGDCQQNQCDGNGA